MTEIVLPMAWTPRPYQRPLWEFLERGGKRAVAVWHRRAGKDAVCLHRTAVAAHERIGTYWHMLPTNVQGRRVVWDAIDGTGRRVIDHVFPPVLRQRVNSAEMKIDLKCGSIWQVCGSDNYNSLVGANPVGVVFSEFALADPAAWDFIRPILAENGGWAIFAFTPRGRNHGHTLFEMARSNAAWFAEKLDVGHTRALPADAIERERLAGMSEAMIAQEFYCSFDAPLVGAYYGDQMAAALDEGRIGRVPWDPDHPVETWWDLGIHDSTAIWFAQQIDREIWLIDYVEEAGKGLAYFAKEILERPYAFSRHVAPFDIGYREWGTGKTRLEVARNFGIRFSVAPKLPRADGIDAARALLHRCRFDEEKCGRGIEALRQYRKVWDDGHCDYRDEPLHDWSSHAADAFRYGAVSLKRASPLARPTRAFQDYDILQG